MLGVLLSLAFTCLGHECQDLKTPCHRMRALMLWNACLCRPGIGIYTLFQLRCVQLSLQGSRYCLVIHPHSKQNQHCSMLKSWSLHSPLLLPERLTTHSLALEVMGTYRWPQYEMDLVRGLYSFKNRSTSPVYQHTHTKLLVVMWPTLRCNVSCELSNRHIDHVTCRWSK